MRFPNFEWKIADNNSRDSPPPKKPSNSGKAFLFMLIRDDIHADNTGRRRCKAGLNTQYT